MEDKAILRAEYHKKIYSESEKNNFVREAVAQTREDFFSFFRESVEGLITERLLNFCTSHPAITSMDSDPKLPSIELSGTDSTRRALKASIIPRILRFKHR